MRNDNLLLTTERLRWTQRASLPDPNGVAGAFVGVSGDALLVAGGANFPEKPLWSGGQKIWHDAAYVLTEPGGQWKTGFQLPRPLGYGVSVTTNNGLVCIGGSDADRHFADVFLLKWSAGKLETSPMPALPRPVANACGALVGNTIYVAGGTESPDATATVKTFYALRGERWDELSPWPGPGRSLAMAATLGGAFYLVGGVELSDGKRRYLRDAYRYDANVGWKRVADLPHPVCAAPTPGPAWGHTDFLVLGGDDGAKAGFQPVALHPGFPNEILAYHTVTDTWTPVGEMAAPRVTTSTAVWHKQVVVPSGEMRPGLRSPEVWTCVL